MDKLAKARRCVRCYDDKGFTTVGMAVALLVCLALVFTSAQVYRVASASAEIQEVADAAALAAQNEIAEFMVVVRTCDALVLSMTLLGVASYGAGVVALCVPSAAPMGKQLIEFGQKTFEARDSFAAKAVESLNSLQSALPFLAVARAAAVAAANNGAGAGGSYYAVALAFPFEGKAIELGDNSATETLVSSVSEGQDGLEQSAALAEEAASRAQDAKQQAFEADCGAAPEACMYERAGRLANLDASRNPLFQSVDAWSFSVALERARAYYAARYSMEAPASSAVDEQANSAIRKAFYAYAMRELDKAYVVETDATFDAWFPLFPSNVDELRESSWYTEAVWPVSWDGAALVPHAWSGCPGVQGSTGLKSLRDIEEGSAAACSVCQFGIQDVGGVAAASSAISNGFEHHYEVVAEAAAEYEKAHADAAPHVSEAQRKAQGMIEALSEALGSLGNVRIQATPPGSLGVMALVVNASTERPDEGFKSTFVGDAGQLGVRVAVAGATMIEDPADEDGSVVASLLDGVDASGFAVGAAGVALECWSGLLEAYGNGQKTLEKAMGKAADSIPLVGSSGLGSWARKKVGEAIDNAGLQPADMDALKPVIVNTELVVAHDATSFSRAYTALKDQAAQSSGSAATTMQLLLETLRIYLGDQVFHLEDKIEVARVQLPVGGVEIPIAIALPSQVGQFVRNALDACFAKVGEAYGQAALEEVWE